MRPAFDGGIVRQKQFKVGLLEFVEEMEWRKVFLVGHSMGGAVALTFALQ